MPAGESGLTRFCDGKKEEEGGGPVGKWLLTIAAFVLLALPKAATGGVRIDCPSHFALGDSVCFTWVNDEAFDICGYSEPPWVIFDPDTLLAAPCGGPLVIIALPAGQSKRYCWDQKNCGGEQVPVGQYDLSIMYGNGVGCAYIGSIHVSFSIDEPPAGQEDKTWGTLKSLYR
jgi:hypothetical protein